MKSTMSTPVNRNDGHHKNYPWRQKIEHIRRIRWYPDNKHSLKYDNKSYLCVRKVISPGIMILKEEKQLLLHEKNHIEINK